MHMDRLIREIEQLAGGGSPAAIRDAHSTLAPRAPVSSKARYFLFFLPKSGMGWFIRIVFAWSFADTIALLIDAARSGAADRDAIFAVSGYAAIAAVSLI